MLNEGIKTFTANGALATKRRVKLTAASTTTPPQVEYAGAGEQHIGITEYAVADGVLVAVRLRTYPGTHEGVAAEAIEVGDPLYGAANGMIKDTSDGTCIGIAIEAATALNDIIEFIDFTVISATAAGISIADAGNFTAQVTVEAALQEIYQDLLTAQGIINIPVPYFSAAGVALAAFADGASDVPGFCVTSKGMGVRWNNHAAPLPVATKALIPPDADITANMTLHVIAAKVGATAGDLPKFTVGAFNNVVGALYDADTDFGGDTDAMINAATKTIQHVTFTLALADLAAYPNLMEITLKPKAGTLGTDDLIMFGAFIAYKKKILTS